MQPGLCGQTSSGLNIPFLWQPEAQSRSGLSLWGSVREQRLYEAAETTTRTTNKWFSCFVKECTLFSERMKCRTSPCFIYGRTTRGSPSLGSIMPSRDRMLGWWKPFMMRPSRRNWSTSPKSVIPVNTKTRGYADASLTETSSQTSVIKVTYCSGILQHSGSPACCCLSGIHDKLSQSGLRYRNKCCQNSYFSW